MTIQELNNQFDITYNAIASMSAPGLDSYEKSVFLTKAQLEIVKDYYDPLSNKKQKGFEGSEKRRRDLEEILIPFNSTTIITSNTGISTNSKFFKIPDDVFVIAYENATVSSEGCYFGKNIKIIPKTHDEYNVQIDNPFRKPNNESIWRLNITNIGNDRVSELISPYTLSNYNIRYIKYPEPIILADLNTDFPDEGLSIDGVTTSQTCKLNKSIHEEILDRAVELALQAYKPSNLETKIQLDTRNE